VAAVPAPLLYLCLWQFKKSILLNIGHCSNLNANISFNNKRITKWVVFNGKRRNIVLSKITLCEQHGPCVKSDLREITSKKNPPNTISRPLKPFIERVAPARLLCDLKRN
jgi:hypothetical protein